MTTHRSSYRRQRAYVRTPKPAPRLCACGRPVSAGRTTWGTKDTRCMLCETARALATPQRKKGR